VYATLDLVMHTRQLTAISELKIGTLQRSKLFTPILFFSLLFTLFELQAHVQQMNNEAGGQEP